jgi:hypothetical protein
VIDGLDDADAKGRKAREVGDQRVDPAPITAKGVCGGLVAEDIATDDVAAAEGPRTRSDAVEGRRAVRMSAAKQPPQSIRRARLDRQRDDEERRLEPSRGESTR